MSVGRSFRLDENGYAVSGMVEAKEWTASARIGLHRFPGEVIAFDEHFIDFVNGLSAVTRRTARPERRQELVLWRG